MIGCSPRVRRAAGGLTLGRCLLRLAGGALHRRVIDRLTSALHCTAAGSCLPPSRDTGAHRQRPRAGARACAFAPASDRSRALAKGSSVAPATLVATAGAWAHTSSICRAMARLRPSASCGAGGRASGHPVRVSAPSWRFARRGVGAVDRSRGSERRQPRPMCRSGLSQSAAREPQLEWRITPRRGQRTLPGQPSRQLNILHAGVLEPLEPEPLVEIWLRVQTESDG
jgi:hypothetical protein